MEESKPPVPVTAASLPARAAALLPKPWTPQELSPHDSGPHRGAQWLLIAIAAFFAVALLWSWLARIDEVTRGDGRIITASQTQYVQHLEGGIVTQILVREGQAVEKGQVLFRIDPTRQVSEFQGTQQEALGLKARVARLEAEAQGTPFRMPDDVKKTASALAQNESALYEARRLDLENKAGILREQVAQRSQELVEVRGRAARLSEGLGFLTKEISMTAPLVKDGVVSEVEVLRLERESARVRTDLDGARLAMPRIQASIGEARRKMQEIELAFRSQAGAELAEAKAKLAKLEESVPALQDRVARAEVRSPVKGVVKTIPNKTPGGVVQPGSPLAEIVPLDDSLLAEVRIRPSDIAFVSVGLPAVVKLAAYDFSIYGGMPGKVVHVSGDSIQPPQGDPYFVAHVRTESTALDFQSKKLPVIPGMTVTADVFTGQKSVLDYLLKPVNKARERALRER